MIFCIYMAPHLEFFGGGKLTSAHQGNLLGPVADYDIADCFRYFINLATFVVLVNKLEDMRQWIQTLPIFGIVTFVYLASQFFVFTNTDDSNKVAK